MNIRKAEWPQQQTEIASIRRQVFVEEQSVPEALEWDGLDATASHWLAWSDQGQTVATMRLLSDGHIGRMAVLKNYRGQGIGQALLKSAIEEVKGRGLSQAFLHAQTHAISFYQQVGFSVEGELFMDANIPHRTMTLKVEKTP
jgi:predicted GNAT family N-acyltransferase